MIPTRQRRNEAIKTEFAALRKTGLGSGFVVQQLAEKHYLAPATVECIVWEVGRYKQAGK